MESITSHLAQLAAGDGEDTFWIQLLVMVILATGIGIFGVIKKHKAKHGSAGRMFGRTLEGFVRRWQSINKSLVGRISQLRQALIRTFRRTTGIIKDSCLLLSKMILKTTANRSKTAVSLLKPATGRFWSKPNRTVKTGNRDFHSGMELLTRDFLVEVVERTSYAEMRDITMRTLCFAELVRRGELWAISSDALKTYTLNTEGAFDKSIRYQAMKELAGRTPILTPADEAATGTNA